MHFPLLLKCACFYACIFVCCMVSPKSHPPWSALRLLRIAVSPSGSKYLELELGNGSVMNNSTWKQLGNTSLYLSVFSNSVFVVPTLLSSPAAFGDEVTTVGWAREVYIYRVLLTEGGTNLISLVQMSGYTLIDGISSEGSYRLCVKLEWLDWPSVKSCRLTSTPEATSTCHPVSIDQEALEVDSAMQYKLVRDDHSQAAVIQKLYVPLSDTSTASAAHEVGVAESCEGGVATCTFCSASQAFHGQLLLASASPMNRNSTDLANGNISLRVSAVELDVLGNGTKASTTGSLSLHTNSTRRSIGW